MPGMGIPRTGGGRTSDPDQRARARERLRLVLEAPERLEITQKPGEVVLVDGHHHVDRLIPDGRKRDQLTNVGMTKMRSSWVGGVLVWETDYGDGFEVERRLSVDTAGTGDEQTRRLKVVVRVERPELSKPLELIRYYDPH
jgi:hypothetical protein